MILVTGATGHFGKATINFLLQKGTPANSIAALVRDENKAINLKSSGVNIKVGDYDYYLTLVSAFKGVDKLLFVSGNDLVNRSKHHANIVKAAKAAGVTHVIYTSFERQNETDTSPIGLLAKTHLDTEKDLKASGLSYTILRNNVYADFITMFIGEKVLETGIFFPAGEGKVAFAPRIDMAEAAANVLTSPGYENKEYFISNTENISFQEIAEILSSATGKNITYTSPSPELYIDTLTKVGVPADYVHAFAGFAEAFKQGEFFSNKSDLEKLLGRKPGSAKEFLSQVYSSSKSQLN